MWSIAVYAGNSPFELKPFGESPVLTKDDVSDVCAEFVADPFMLWRADRWHMFFEVMNAGNKLGEIGLATSNDGSTWNYERIVLKERFHLSYPYVFEWQNEHYMIPETLGAGAVSLYKADEFPYRWSCVARLIPGSFADPSIFRFNDLWWMFVCSTPYQHDTLQLYFARDLTGPWAGHPRNPIIRGDKCGARPAGRILNFNNKMFRFAQDCVPQYGTSVRVFEISKLTRETYAEVEVEQRPLLTASGAGWNASGMHHIDAHQHGAKWIACVDGTE
jgi:hypothetical protein